MNEEQNTSVSAFLKQNVKELSNVQIKMERFSAPFIIKPLSTKDMNELRAQNTLTSFDKRTHQKVKTVNQERLTDAMIVRALVTPDLNNQDIQNSYGTVADPAGTIQEMLTAGEYTDLVNAIQDASGFESSIEEDVDEAKK